MKPGTVSYSILTKYLLILLLQLFENKIKKEMTKQGNSHSNSSLSRFTIFFFSLCESNSFHDNMKTWLSIETVSKHLSVLNDERAAEWGRARIRTVFTFSFTHCIEFFYSVWFALTLNTVNRLFAITFKYEQIICTRWTWGRWNVFNYWCYFLEAKLFNFICLFFAASLKHRSEWHFSLCFIDSNIAFWPVIKW